MENIYWKKTVGTLIGAIWLYTLADLAASIAGAVNELLNPSGVMGMLKDLMDGGSGAPSLSMGDIIEGMFSILVVIGYYLFFQSLTRFARLQRNSQDGEHVSTVRTAYILMVVALLADFIPMIGWLISFVLMVISYVKMLSGYRGLKKSFTFPVEAREGAVTLYSCTIWTLVGYVLGCIPLIGGVIEGIITLVVFFTILSAWGRIKNAAPEMTPEEEEVFKRSEIPAYKRILGDALIMYFFITLASTLFNMLPPSSLADSLWLAIGSDLFWSLAFMAIYVWLLCSPQARLNLGAKLGLGSLLLGRILGIFSMFILYRMITDYSLIGPISTANVICYVVGILLFIWSTSASLSIKITITSYVVAMRLLWIYFYKIQLPAISPDASDFSEAVGRLNTIYSLISTGILLITFVLVYYFISRWRKQPEAEVIITTN